MVIGAAGEILAPGFRKGRDYTMFVAELIVTFRGQMAEDAAEKEVELLIATAIDFEIFE